MPSDTSTQYQVQRAHNFTASIKEVLEATFGDAYPWLTFYTQHFDDLCALSGVDYNNLGVLADRLIVAIEQVGALFDVEAGAASDSKVRVRLHHLYAYALGLSLITLHVYDVQQELEFRKLVLSQMKQRRMTFVSWPAVRAAWEDVLSAGR